MILIYFVLVKVVSDVVSVCEFNNSNTYNTELLKNLKH